MSFDETSATFVEVVKRFYYQYAPYLLPDEDNENESVTMCAPAWCLPTGTSPQNEVERNGISTCDYVQHSLTDKPFEGEKANREDEEAAAEDDYELVMTEEAKQLFISGERRRRERRRQREEERKRREAEMEREEAARLKRLHTTWQHFALSRTVIHLQNSARLPELAANMIADSFPQRISYGANTSRICSLENALNLNFDRLCGDNGDTTQLPILWPEFPIRVLPRVHQTEP
jgi:hypothetical protein